MVERVTVRNLSTQRKICLIATPSTAMFDVELLYQCVGLGFILLDNNYSPFFASPLNLWVKSWLCAADISTTLVTSMLCFRWQHIWQSWIKPPPRANNSIGPNFRYSVIDPIYRRVSASDEHNQKRGTRKTSGNVTKRTRSAKPWTRSQQWRKTKKLR